MCKAASTIGRIGSGIVTGGLSEAARAGLGKDNIVSKVLQTPGTILTGGASRFGVDTGGSSYTPTTLTPDNPKLLLAQTGGAQVLSQVAMGSSVEDALAGYFGRNKGADWESYQGNLSPDEKAAIDNVRSQLTQIQSNTDLRNKAVQSVVQDFPNIAAHSAQARVNAGEEFDSTTKQYIDLALGKKAAQYAAGGNLSSGAYDAASARAGAEIGMSKLNYMDERGNTDYGQGLDAWNARYTEANALRNFQQKMLGQGAQNGFSANQDMLTRNAHVNMFNTNLKNQKDMYDQQRSDSQDQALFGTLGTLAGTVAGGMIAGPPGAMAGASMGKAGGLQGASAYGFNGPATPGYGRNNAANNPLMNWG